MEFIMAAPAGNPMMFRRHVQSGSNDSDSNPHSATEPTRQAPSCQSIGLLFIHFAGILRESSPVAFDRGLGQVSSGQRLPRAEPDEHRRERPVKVE